MCGCELFILCGRSSFHVFVVLFSEYSLNAYESANRLRGLPATKTRGRRQKQPKCWHNLEHGVDDRFQFYKQQKLARFKNRQIHITGAKTQRIVDVDDIFFVSKQSDLTFEPQQQYQNPRGSSVFCSRFCTVAQHSLSRCLIIGMTYTISTAAKQISNSVMCWAKLWTFC